MTPSNYHPPYQGGRAYQPENQERQTQPAQSPFGQHPNPNPGPVPNAAYAQAYGSSYGGANVYGAAPMSGQNNTTRLTLIIVGWAIAFVMPVLGIIVNYTMHGADPIGLTMVIFLLGPTFFVLQAILNISYLALPKEQGISVFHLWAGHALWWGGTLIAAAMIRTPGGFNEETWADGAMIDDPVMWDTLWSMTFIWAILAAVGFLWVIVGIVLAVRDSDNKRKFAYRQQPWGQA